MERLILRRLVDWKNSPYRKPLILKGVRQVGKTWLLREFGKQYYELFPDQVKLRIRMSLDNLKLDGDVLNVPLFMADHLDRMIGTALERM